MSVTFIVLGLHFSGAEIVLADYIKRNKEINAEVITIFKDEQVINSFEEIVGRENVKCLNIPYNRVLLRLFSAIYSRLIMKKLLKNVEGDIAYFNNTYEGLLLAKWVDKLGRPAVLHIHDMKNSIRNPYLIKASESYLTNFSRILTVSKECKKSWDNEEIKVVYNGLAEEWFCCSNIKIDKITTVGFVGALTYRKGADLLVKAIGDILAEGHDFTFTIIYHLYDDKIKAELDKLVLRYGTEKIKVIRNAAKNEMEKLYEDIEAIVVPSREDPLPTVIMEAAAKNILCIGSNVGGIPELIGSKRCICKMDSSAEVKKAIVSLADLAEEDIASIIEENREYIKKNFTVKEKDTLINRYLWEIR